MQHSEPLLGASTTYRGRLNAPIIYSDAVEDNLPDFEPFKGALPRGPFSSPDGMPCTINQVGYTLGLWVGGWEGLVSVVNMAACHCVFHRMDQMYQHAATGKILCSFDHNVMPWQCTVPYRKIRICLSQPSWALNYTYVNEIFRSFFT